MRYLKRFNESATFLTDKEEIGKIMKDLKVDDYDIEEDGSVNINWDIDITFDKINHHKGDRKFDETVLPIKFNHVGGEFRFRGYTLRPTLTSLEGSPKSCRSFRILTAKITNLQGSPIIVEESFECSYTLITSLEGCPRHIPQTLDVYSNKLTDFRGGPEEVGENLIATSNPLTSLEGLPKIIGSRLHIDSPLLWDPTPLRNVQHESIVTGGTKIDHLIELFYNLHNHRRTYPYGFANELPYQTFIESLDYNWIKGDVNDPKIDLFRFMEALDEFGLSLNNLKPDHRQFHSRGKQESIGPYKFVNLDGDRVNAKGEKIK